MWNACNSRQWKQMKTLASLPPRKGYVVEGTSILHFCPKSMHICIYSCSFIYWILIAMRMLSSVQVRFIQCSFLFGNFSTYKVRVKL